ncbi:MAG: hypothetical protein WBB18_10080 [Nodosilinea sp.]
MEKSILVAESMKRRGVVYGLLATLGAVLLLASPLSLQAPAQQAPPLRDLVREYEVVTMPAATAYSVYTTSAAVPHQMWYRIYGGDALFRQRLRVYQENAAPRPINELPPASELQQEVVNNNPTGWYVMPQETDIFTYYFDGDNRVTARSPWRDAFGVRVKRTRYANGNRYDLTFEDQDTLDDFNDLKLEIVMMQPA